MNLLYEHPPFLRPFAILQSNITIRPVKLLIDTGSPITLLASNLIISEIVFIENERKKLQGVAGSNVQIQTDGCTHAMLSSNDNDHNCVMFDVKMYLVDKKQFAQEDGYLGFDVLHQYNATIDIPNKKMTFRVKN